MTYTKKLLNLRTFVNFGLNKKAANFVLYWYCESLKDDFEVKVKQDPDTMRYIDNLLLHYRRQLPLTDRELQGELRKMQITRKERAQKQFSLFT